MQSVLITGAGGEIGRAIAKVFAKNGWSLFLCGHSENSTARISAYAKELEEKYSVKTLIASLDVSSKEECIEAVSRVYDEFGCLNAVINNAGIIEYSTLARTREEDYKSVISCNTDGVFFMMQASFKAMRKTKSGSIVNVSSVAGINGCPGSGVYAASKGAVNALTKTASVEFAPYGIRVNAVAPGMIEGGMSGLLSVEQIERSSQSIAMKRFGKPEEVAEAVYFLASPKASYITGTILTVDGGLL